MIFFVFKKLILEEYLDLLKLILPSMLVEHFHLVKSEQLGGKLNLYFEEKSEVPQELNSRQLISKGFHNEITIQDFPLRGKLVFLHVKRRRWTDKQTNEILQRDWDVVAKGTRMTNEFASFLKSINKY